MSVAKLSSRFRLVLFLQSRYNSIIDTLRILARSMFILFLNTCSVLASARFPKYSIRMMPSLYVNDGSKWNIISTLMECIYRMCMCMIGQILRTGVPLRAYPVA